MRRLPPSISSAPQTLELMVHLVGREFSLRYRRAAFGWFWSVAQPLARFLVLSFVFTQILPLDIPRYPAFLFVGLVAWSWFASGVLSATTSAIDRRDLLYRPGLSRFTAPVVSVATDGLDFLAALPVMGVFLLLDGGIPVTALALPVVMVLQLCLVLGLGLLLCSANVHYRDVRLFVDVALLLGFYLTPVFYRLVEIPEGFRDVLALNPMARLLGAYRSLLIDARLPEALPFAALALTCLAVLAVGALVYERASGSFIDEL